MKKVSLICLILVTTECLAQAQSQKTIDDFKKLDWLSGTWTRTDAKPGKSGHERWSKVGSEWIGFGVSMKGADTSFVEKLKIVMKDDAVYYVSDVPENKEPVYFKITAITSNGFVSENAKHDFPKKIAYVLEGTRLKATISGDGKAMDYRFERSK